MKRSNTMRNTRKRSRVLHGFTIVNLAALIILYLAESIVAERHWFGTAVTYAPQHFYGVPAVVLLLWAVFKMDKRMVALNLLTIAFFGSSLLGYCVPWRAAVHNLRAPASDEIRLRVMTYNILHSLHGVTAVADQVGEANADIVCLQEANAVRGSGSAASEIRKSGKRWYAVEYGELVVLSRYPITSHRLCQMESVTGRVLLKVVLDVDGRPVTVVNAHLNSSLRPRSVRSDTISIPDRLDNAAEVRSVQVAAVMDVVDGVHTPLILAGDFNTPPRGRVYRRIARRLSDSFRAAGWGLGYTFRSDVPVMRIDYVFLGGGARAKRCEVPLTGASDHLPVVADVVIPR